MTGLLFHTLLSEVLQFMHVFLIILHVRQLNSMLIKDSIIVV